MAMVIGVDCYNQVTTGDVSITLRAAAGGVDTTPCVLVMEDDSNDDREEIF